MYGGIVEVVVVGVFEVGCEVVNLVYALEVGVWVEAEVLEVLRWVSDAVDAVELLEAGPELRDAEDSEKVEVEAVDVGPESVEADSGNKVMICRVVEVVEAWSVLVMVDGEEVVTGKVEGRPKSVDVEADAVDDWIS